MGYVPQKLDFDYSSPVSVIDIFSATLSTKTCLVFYFQRYKKKSS